jgi:hypothetical protein
MWIGLGPITMLKINRRVNTKPTAAALVGLLVQSVDQAGQGFGCCLINQFESTHCLINIKINGLILPE